MAQTYVIGRVTADLELKTSINRHPYVRFDIAENIGGKEHRRTQYLQICAMGDDAERLVRARVKKGSLIWVSGSLELEVYTRRDGVTTDKRLKVLLDNWGFVPVGTDKAATKALDSKFSESLDKISPVIDGEREALPG